MVNEYESPIRSLYDDIINVFESCSEPMTERLHSAVWEGYASNFVYIDPDFAPIKTPNSNLETRQIQLQATHLSFLWMVCYSMIGFQEITHEQANADADILKFHNSPQFQELALAVNWGVELNKMWRPWPDGIPTPDQSGDRVVFTNELFLYAIRYLMYHEFAHLTLHTNSKDIAVKIKQKTELNSEEIRRFKAMEFQADDYAFGCMFLTSEDQSQKYMKVLGAVIAYISSLYLPNYETHINYHPSLAYRLKRILKKANITEEPYFTFLHITIALGLQVHLTLKGIPYLDILLPKGPFERIMELEVELFALLD